MRFCLLLLLLTLPLRAAELSSSDAQALLQSLAQHRAKFPSFTADFLEEKTTRLLTKPLTSSGTIAFQTPNQFRREVTGKNPSLTVCNGEKLWIYYPGFQEAELYTLGQKAFFDDSIAALTAGLNFQRIEKFFTYRATPEPGGHRILLLPRSSGLKRLLKELTVWFDDDLRIQRTEATLPKGDRVVTTYKNQRFTSVPAKTFDFTPPAGANISQPLGQ